MKKVAISIGDINGIGLEIALKSHKKISKLCKPIYFVDDEILHNASKLLDIKIPKGFHNKSIKKHCSKKVQDSITNLINPAKITRESGEYSFKSLQCALQYVNNKKADALLTLPIHKKAWNLAGIDYIGHTDFLSKYFNDNGIMMLGSNKLFVALFSDHIPLYKVPQTINFDALCEFLEKIYKNFKFNRALVLGLNPHAGDNGVLGSEDEIINQAINHINKKLKKKVFHGAISPDVAFSKENRKKYKIFIAMYHDQGLIPLKALYFEESINITLGLPILRTSVDHGVAFDIAYKNKANTKSYINALDFIIKNEYGRLFSDDNQ